MAKALCELVLTGYTIRRGSGLDRAQLIKFMHCTYQELYPDASFDHLAQTADRYLSNETPLWWAEADSPVACLWLGLAIDQVSGQQYPHIFLLYVSPEHRRQGIGSALMQQAEDWAKARGDSQIGLQVFQQNQAAVGLYRKLGFEPMWIGMMKPLEQSKAQ